VIHKRITREKCAATREEKKDEYEDSEKDYMATNNEAVTLNEMSAMLFSSTDDRDLLDGTPPMTVLRR
jgi:hypothetical protein